MHLKEPLRFTPIFRRYVWGGRRLGDVLGKPIGPESDYAESWEIVDRGSDQSVVAYGPLAGTSLRQLMEAAAEAILGKPCPAGRFPLLLKFLDCCRSLSVQVHPDDERAARLEPPDLGKTEAWVVIDALPGSRIYAGLRRGIDRATLEREVRSGNVERCLHSFEPAPGDCVFLPAGVVHAAGAGLLLAEIQQSSDATFRLYDWNRLGSDGRPRPLHLDAALEAIDYRRGPVRPRPPLPTDREHIERLVACDKFVLDRWRFDAPRRVGDDGRCHLLAVLAGAVAIEHDPAERPLTMGQTALLPAAAAGRWLTPHGAAEMLDIYLP